MSATRALSLLVATFVAWNICCGQTQNFDLCAVTRLDADSSAHTLVSQILEELVQKPGTILVFASTDPGVANRRGAASSECPVHGGMERWIVYDPDVIPPGAGLEFALAHETAHHLNLHILNENTPRNEQELEADKYAARYLTMLGWDEKRLLRALDDLKLPKEAQGGYPSLDERKAAVIAGYEETAKPRPSHLGSRLDQHRQLHPKQRVTIGSTRKRN